MTAGIAELVPATVMKTPAYWPHGFLTNPIIGSPMREIRQRKQSTGPRVLYLSENQAAAYIRMPEKTYGGAPRH